MANGHIRRRGKRSWEIKYDAGRDPKTGKRLTRYLSVKGTRKDAERKRAEIMVSIHGGTYVDPSKITVGKYLSNWLRTYAKPNVSPKTFERWQEIVELHLIPALGHIRMAELRAAHLIDYYVDAVESGRIDGKGGLAAQTVKHHHSVLKLALREAVAVGTLLVNPAASVKPPKPKPVPLAVLTEQELGVLFKATAGSRMYVLILLAATTGMRRGELLGLRWKHVSLDGANIQVVASLEQTAAGLRLKQPKTKAGRRSISLPSIAVDILRLHKISQAEERLKMGSGYDNQDFVFATIEGQPLNPRNVTKQFSRIVARTDIPRISFHGLRHTHITLLLEAGVHPKVASERAGHVSVAITLDIYSHVLPGLQEDAAKKVNNVVRSALDMD